MTESYLLILYSFLRGPGDLETILLACPISSSDKTPFLSYSHFAKLDDVVLSNVRVMCDFTSTSGATKVTLVGRKSSNCRGEDAALAALRLTLDKVERGTTGTPTYELIHLLHMPAEKGWWLEAGPDESARGVYNAKTGSLVLFSIERENDHIRCHESSPLPISNDVHTQSAIAFDGYRGMICVKIVNKIRNVRVEVWALTGSDR